MKHDESFIPWEQIEPLLVAGMTGEQMVRAVLTRLGLDPGRYTLVARDVVDAELKPLKDIARHGLYVMTDEQSKAIDAEPRGHEVVA